jgi:hypothetical protein
MTDNEKDESWEFVWDTKAPVPGSFCNVPGVTLHTHRMPNGTWAAECRIHAVGPFHDYANRTHGCVTGYASEDDARSAVEKHYRNMADACSIKAREEEKNRLFRILDGLVGDQPTPQASSSGLS